MDFRVELCLTGLPVCMESAVYEALGHTVRRVRLHGKCRKPNTMASDRIESLSIVLETSIHTAAFKAAKVNKPFFRANA